MTQGALIELVDTKLSGTKNGMKFDAYRRVAKDEVDGYRRRVTGSGQYDAGHCKIPWN